jgi:hypothetical protein
VGSNACLVLSCEQGEAGVASVLRILNEELKHAMLFAGTAKLADIGYVKAACFPRAAGAHQDACMLVPMRCYAALPTFAVVCLRSRRRCKKCTSRVFDWRYHQACSLSLLGWQVQYHHVQFVASFGIHQFGAPSAVPRRRLLHSNEGRPRRTYSGLRGASQRCECKSCKQRTQRRAPDVSQRRRP